MRRSPLKSHCSGLCQKRLVNLLYAHELYRDSSITVPSQWCDMDVENTCLNRPFWTGLRAKHDIIQGAQGWWCVIRKENANA